mmetsp:Transcript_41503/g.132033  ORF Transcript_41503/g.132033 Transcript_41503/m.132033 type:complete len:210 (-) Transcript_41503:182-811(-)
MSSSAKSTPPTGAEKVAPTPTAAAASSTSSCGSCALLKNRELRRLWLTQEATCTKGPSLPTGREPPMESARPAALATSTRRRRKSVMGRPLRMHFTSGMPEPAACGASCTSSRAQQTSSTSKPASTPKGEATPPRAARTWGRRASRRPTTRSTAKEMALEATARMTRSQRKGWPILTLKPQRSSVEKLSASRLRAEAPGREPETSGGLT